MNGLLDAALLLFFILDPLGNIPLFLSLMKHMPEGEQRRVIFREHLVALALLVLFLFGGRAILSIFGIQEPSLSVAGGIILFLIALRMIFPQKTGIFGDYKKKIPFIVPMAIPLIAGPSALTTVLIVSAKSPHEWLKWLLALVMAWLASLVILFFASGIHRRLGPSLLEAMEKLMGMLLVVLSVQMFMNGISRFLQR